MSQPHYQYRFVLKCETIGPLRVGSGMLSELTDNEPRRTAKGQLMIPGTSVAGALRGAVERLVFSQPGHASATCQVFMAGAIARSADTPCRCEVCRLFGDVIPVEGAAVSRVWAHDVVLPESAAIRIADAVALERSRRVAADARKFDFVEVAQGTAFWIDIRGDDLTDPELKLLGAALALLANGRVSLGGHSSRGAGLVRGTEACIRRRNLRDAEHVVEMAISNELEPGVRAGTEPAWPDLVVASLDQFPGEGCSFPDHVRIVFHLVPDETQGDTYLVNDPVESLLSGYDRAPRGGVAAAELPASSLRGALRSGAERIMRTIAGAKRRVCDPATAPCKKPRVAANEAEPPPESWCCPACQIFGNTDFASRLHVAVERDPGGSTTRAPFDHLAIDRFTGGSRDTLKFDALAARGGEFKVNLTLDRVNDHERPWVIALLGLTLQDLQQGRITVGHGGSKGHGFFRIKHGRLNWEPDFSTVLPKGWDHALDELWKKLGCERPKAESGAAT